MMRDFPYLLQQLQYRVRKYRSELTAVVGTVVVGLISWSLGKIPRYSDPLFLPFAADVLLIVLVLLLLFNLKRLFDTRFQRINHILIDQFGLSWRDTQYSVRLRHFAQEKNKIAAELVRTTLPEIVKTIYDEYRDVRAINLILDSGTTITPVFPLLLRHGLGACSANGIRIYTNNLAGIDEMRKADPRRGRTFEERDFNLIGGRPLSKYRATTGDVTRNFLKGLWAEQRQLPHEVVTVGVLTANWFVVSHDWTEISLCARGQGHLDFKVSVAENAHYVILVAPLGKILPLGTLGALNGLLPHGETEYGAHKLDQAREEKTILLTSFRPDETLSPLLKSTRQLRGLPPARFKNYRLANTQVEFDPDGDRGEVLKTDLPHAYIRVRGEEIFGPYP